MNFKNLKSASMPIWLVIILAIVPIFVGTQTSVAVSQCQMKAQTASELIDLATKMKSLAKYEMGIPDICYEFNGKADNHMRVNSKKITAEEIKELRIPAREAMEAADSFRSKSSFFYKSLRPRFSVLPDEFQELRKKNFSGGSILLATYSTRLYDHFNTFIQTCSDSPKYVELWKEMDVDVDNFASEISQVMKQCPTGSIYGAIIQNTIILLAVLGIYAIFVTVICSIVISVIRFIQKLCRKTYEIEG